MKLGTEDHTSYKKTVRAMRDNSYHIDNLSQKEPYINQTIPFFETSRANLHLFSNPLIDECTEELLRSGKVHHYDDLSLKNRYQYKPEMISQDNYGTPGYWYIILAVNGYLSKFDFHGFDHIIVPQLKTIHAIIRRYEKTGKLQSQSSF